MRARIRPIIIVAATAASFLVGVTPPAVAAAPTGPGALSHFDLARKDCLGTARNTTSKIWYTVAGGVLSDVYAPTIDTTNIETMQYLVTDGSSFTDLQTRDTTYTVSADSTGMICTVTSTAKSGKYRLTTTYLTDPARASVVMHTQYTPLTAAARGYHLYVRMDATAGGNGGGRRRSEQNNGGADNAVLDASTRGDGLLRHGHRDECRESRLRGADLPRAARRPAVPGRRERLRRHAERRPDPARLRARADPERDGNERQRRADGGGFP